MITMVNASATTPRSAIENATPLVLAITTVAAAVPGPQTTRAAVPRNSAATFRGRDASALEPIDRPRHPGGVAGLNSSDKRSDIGTPFGQAEQHSADRPPLRGRCQETAGSARGDPGVSPR